MKYLLLFILLTISSINVEGQVKKTLANTLKVKSNIEAYLKPRMNDPGTYSFVSLSLIDSVSYLMNIESYRERHQNTLDLKLAVTDTVQMNGISDWVRDNRNEIAKERLILRSLDSIKVVMGKRVNNTAAYLYSISFRAKNGFGGRMLYRYLVQTQPGPLYKVLAMGESWGKLQAYPNGFPGLKELEETPPSLRNAR